MSNKPIYVEIDINCSIDEAWTYTQQPQLHEQWDLRFSRITYLDKAHEDEPQRFTYTTNVLPGVSVSGWGESKGTHEKESGVKTSSLHFGTKQRISPIQEGKGYWQYVPRQDGMTFLTQYDYDVRYGAIDKIFRPMIGWTTALSFDVLARWLEQGERPRTQYRRFFSYYVLIALFVFIWLYQGLVPKVIGQHPLEIAMLMELSPMSSQHAATAIVVVGLLEIIVALLFCVRKLHKPLLIAQVVLFPLLTVSAIVAAPHVATDPFNVVTFNVLLWGLSIVALMLRVELPTASSCKRKRGASHDL
ncbi:MAG: DoxX-like family protein [Caryophanon sp.]|nr:DoxX-like family protein [Caryophanon sp.]